MEANDASLVQGDATTRAQELRASLGARQDAETMLAEAGRIRQDAAAAADALVEEAQQLSAQLVAESKRAAEQVAEDARVQADGVLAQARTEAEEVTAQARASADALRAAAETEIEEHRRRVRAEVAAQVTHELTEQHRAAEARAREESEALISDLEASVRILGVSLESSLSNVSELLGSLEALRPAAGPGTARTGATRVADLVPESLREPLTDPLTEPLAESSAETRSEPVASDPLPEQRRSRPAVGDRVDDILFGGGQHVGSTAPGVPSATSPFGTDDEAPDPDRPRSATEAFLSSSSIEIEQASRELRDLQHPEEARRRRGDESRRAADEREPSDDGSDDDEPPPSDEARPLGWLFRSAQ